MNGATMFSGGEGVGVAMREMGIKHLWGIEHDDSIAGVAKMNGFKSIIGDVRTQDYSRLARPDILHASPVCKNASMSNVMGKESSDDVETANAVCDALRILKPRIFTLENVWGYRKFSAFKNICATLSELGYYFGYWHLNTADYGVAQQRKRMCLIARLDNIMPVVPHKTHTNNPGYDFGKRQRWVGWYTVVDDLVSTFPDSKFGDWQINYIVKHLKKYKQTFAANTRESHFGSGLTTVYANEPFYSIMATSATSRHKAFIVNEDRSPALNTGDTIHQWMSIGRVVNLTPRALARIHSFPDSYELPESDKLATTIIGNSVPPRLYQEIIKSLEFKGIQPIFA